MLICVNYDTDILVREFRKNISLYFKEITLTNIKGDIGVLLYNAKYVICVTDRTLILGMQFH